MHAILVLMFSENQKIGRIFRIYSIEIFITLLFLVTRLLNLNGLPIFNDEGIYLDWGWQEINFKDNLYYSLFDGKQPFLMWVFGIFQYIIEDPLIAGRIVSVITGFLTLIGVYLISRKFFNITVARLSALLYVLIPIFVFFDRQALMESSISAVGIWIFYFLTLNLSKPRLILGILIGTLIGLGLFIKSNASLFLAAFLITSLYAIFKSNESKFKIKFLLSLTVALLVSATILYPLIIQDDFGNIMEMNSRFAYSFTEIFIDLQKILTQNLRATIQIFFWHLNPVLFIVAITSFIFLIKSRVKNFDYFLAWIFSTLAVFILFTKNPSPRYIVSILPIFSIIVALGLHELWKLNRKFVALSAIGIYISIYFTYALVVSPLSYFYLMRKLTPAYSNQEYVHGWTSGYGVKSAYDYLNKLANNERIKIVVRVDYGNPESSIFAYTNNRENIETSFMDFKCKGSKASFHSKNDLASYFVSRGLHLDGREKCMKQLKKFYKPYESEFVGVYSINQ